MSDDSAGMHSPDEALTDGDRELLVANGRQAVGDERLTLEDFAELAARVYAAGTRRDVAGAVTAAGVALPASWHPPGDDPAPAPAVGASRRPGRRWVVSIFGSSAATGRWRASSTVRCIAVLGSARIDLRQVTLDPEVGGIRVWAFVLFGSIEVTVPSGVDTTLGGTVVFGSTEMKVAHPPAIPAGVPDMDIQAFGLFGSVEVRS